MSVVSKVRDWTDRLGGLVSGRRVARLQAPGGLRLLNEGDGHVEERIVDGKPQWRPAADSYHLYLQLPDGFPEGPLHVEVQYFGTSHGPFKLQYPWRKNEGALGGKYIEAPQLWTGETGASQLRRCRYDLPDFDRNKRQNYNSNFRLVQLEGGWIHDIAISNLPFPKQEQYSQFLPSVILRKRTDRFHKIQSQPAVAGVRDPETVRGGVPADRG